MTGGFHPCSTCTRTACSSYERCTIEEGRESEEVSGAGNGECAIIPTATVLALLMLLLWESGLDERSEMGGDRGADDDADVGIGSGADSRASLLAYSTHLVQHPGSIET